MRWRRPRVPLARVPSRRRVRPRPEPRIGRAVGGENGCQSTIEAREARRSSRREPVPLEIMLDRRLVAGLREVLRGVVRLLPSQCRARVSSSTSSTRRRALGAVQAHEPYARLAGTIALERGRGLAWWAGSTGSRVIRENSAQILVRSSCPSSTKTSFSRCGVPILGRDDAWMGVISAHTSAARVHAAGGGFLVSSASLVAGATRRAPVRRDAGQGERARAGDRARGGDRRSEMLDELLPP